MMGFDNPWINGGLGLGVFGTWLGIFLLPLLIWGIAWKGWALWKAARENSKVWFIALLFINTVGILDILYIFVFSSKKEKLTLLKSKRK